MIDYVVTKIPRWAFEKLPGTTGILGTQMQSVGEVMAIGRTFPESLQKALRSLEQGRAGLNCDPAEAQFDATGRRRSARRVGDRHPRSARSRSANCSGGGVSIERSTTVTRIDPWFLDQISMIVEERHALADERPATMTRRDWRRAKRLGFSDAQLAYLWGVDEADVRTAREAGRRDRPRTRRSTRAPPSSPPRRRTTTRPTRTRARSRASDRQKVVILGSGPNRIGQGIEFDYCCVHASVRPARRRLRDGDGQLQPRDGLDRLRHVATGSTSNRSPPRTCSTSSPPSGTGTG